MIKARIYLISGLGADRRAFKKFRFPDHLEMVHLDWLPLTPQDSLEDYAQKLAAKIDPQIPFYLVGLSFGGMLATEIARKMKPLHTFLISSIWTTQHLPWYHKLAGFARLQKMVPLIAIKNLNRIGLRQLGARSPDEKRLLRQLVLDSDPRFIKWALNAILHWRNTERPEPITHLHGNADKILPIKYTQPDIIIKDAGHFMVYANAAELTEHLLAIINKKTPAD